MTGIVQNRLDANEYPVLEPGNLYQAHSYQGQKNLVTDAQSLAYLFDETNMFGKRAYRDVRGMVQYENGYYVYDSSKNYAAYNSDTGNLSLYKQPAVSNDSRFDHGPVLSLRFRVHEVLRNATVLLFPRI